MNTRTEYPGFISDFGFKAGYWNGIMVLSILRLSHRKVVTSVGSLSVAWLAV